MHLRDVHLVSISFDLEHDQPARLGRYAAEMRADSAYWTLAPPAPHDDALALLRSLTVVVVPDGEGGFVHNGAIHLLDERGSLRGRNAPVARRRRGEDRQLVAGRLVARRQLAPHGCRGDAVLDRQPRLDDRDGGSALRRRADAALR